jgi:diaminopimelate epimerase
MTASRSIDFTKMHGLGNEFVIIDAMTRPCVLTPKLVRRIADRHFGVGCDQVLMVEPPNRPEADFYYRIFNADGTEAEQCGNGARCFARFVYKNGLINRKNIVLETRSGMTQVRILDDDQVTVDMGQPLPLILPHDEPVVPPSTYAMPIREREITFTSVSMGNPHAVVTVDDVDRAPVNSLGRQLGDRRDLFPQGVNVGFMRVRGKDRIRLRVYERGTGETLACGSGACAAFYAAHSRNLIGNHALVDLPGGQLAIMWGDDGQSVLMTGPATFVYTGNIEL